MNFLVIFSAFVSIFTIISIMIEPRRFRNGLFFLFSIGCWFLTLLQYYFMYNSKTVEILLILLIISLPILYGFIMLYLFINGLKIIKKEGFYISHSLSLLFSLLMLFLPFIFLILLCINFRTGHFGISLAAGTLLTYFLITFTIFFCYSLLYCLLPRRLNCQYIIIHGAGLLPDGSVTPLLQARIDKAIKIYHKSKTSPKLVPSGGKGMDEKVSEAEAIKNYLIAQGIPEKDIIIENRSTTTYENLLFVI